MLKNSIGPLELDQQVYTRRGEEGTITIPVKYQINMANNNKNWKQ